MLISQLILIPVFAVVIWGYFYFAGKHKMYRFGKIYDTAIISLATILSLLFANYIYSLNYEEYGGVWKPVFAVLASAHTFPLTMLAGLLLKKKLFQSARNEGQALPE